MYHNYAIGQRELLSILFRERRPMLLTFFGCFLFMIALSFIVSPKYEADAKLIIKSGREFETRPDPGQQAGIEPYLTKQEVMNSELEILTSSDLIRATINSVGMNVLYPSLDKSNPKAMDEAVKQFSKGLKVDTALMSEVIDVSYINKNRDVAIKALSTLLQLYQEKHAALFTDNRSQFMSDKNKDYMTRLDNVSTKITDLRESQSLFDVPTQRAQLIQDRSVVAETLRNLQTRSLDEHGHIDYYKQQLRHNSPFVVDDTKNAGDAYREWKMKDPAYVDPIFDDAVMKLQGAEADASAIDAQIALQQRSLGKIDTRLASMEQGQQQLDSLEREHGILEDMVHSTRSTYEQAVTGEEEDRDKLVSVDIFEKPNASLEPAKPRKLLYALVGFMLGFMGACSIVGYNIVFRQLLITSESVERLLGMRVLATIPERG